MSPLVNGKGPRPVFETLACIQAQDRVSEMQNTGNESREKGPRLLRKDILWGMEYGVKRGPFFLSTTVQYPLTKRPFSSS